MVLKKCLSCKNMFEMTKSRCDPCRIKHNDHQKTWHKTEKGQAAMTRGNHSEKGRERSKRFWKSDKGKKKNRAEGAKIAKKRHSKSEKGVASRKRKNRQLDVKILKAVNQLLCGEKKYLSIVDQTCFKTGTAREVKEHFQRTLVGTGWTMDDRGTKWCIEHAIARCWYDHSDPEDVLRCWSHENMYAGDKDAGTAKGVRILDSECIRAGANNWPKAWNGEMPSEEERQKMYDAKLGHNVAANSLE
tara:strand:- start:187 stop:921 length:735 start_codon:yes stop_codon:yes gene_type:complete